MINKRLISLALSMVMCGSASASCMVECSASTVTEPSADIKKSVRHVHYKKLMLDLFNDCDEKLKCDFENWTKLRQTLSANKNRYTRFVRFVKSDIELDQDNMRSYVIMANVLHIIAKDPDYVITRAIDSIYDANNDTIDRDKMRSLMLKFYGERFELTAPLDQQIRRMEMQVKLEERGGAF